MSNSVEGEEEEEFFETLDHVVTSSCSSTSSTDDEGDYNCPKQQHRHSRFPLPSPISFDAWLSEPGSVEERRRHLLQLMGLARDPELARENPNDGKSGVGRDWKMERTASCDGVFRLAYPALAISSGGAFARSRSDGSAEPRILGRQLSSVTGKPPLVGRSRPSVGGELQLFNGEGEKARWCTIKDLGSGKEFVVKELREDGMWNNLREVGTGRQFSMEEFDLCFGSSPIVQELMRRQNGEDRGNGSGTSSDRSKEGTESNGCGRSKRKSSWLKSFKNVVAVGQLRDRRSSDEKDTSSERGGRRSSSATDDSQDALQSLRNSPERIKVRQYGKSHKELTGLFLSQEIQAHNGSIWTIKFSLDGRYLASAGEDCVIHAWQVFEHDRKLEFLVDQAGQENGNGNPHAANPNNGSPEEVFLPSCTERSHLEKKISVKGTIRSKSLSSDHVMLPEQAFALLERPVCSFIGHLDDVLDLSWSKSQYLLSSSMDMTVRLWHFSSNSCLKIFSHSDYVTCVQFNPVDDRYFISGSLDAKVRLWSIPDRQVVDWNDLYEIVTAACYRPDGQGALVGSNEGNCHLYDTFDNKLLRKSQIDLQNKKKKSGHTKISGFQFVPGKSSEVLITSADSRIRVVDGTNLLHKFKGFRNTGSQICASPTANGKHIICASEDSNVYVWRYDTDRRSSRSNSVVNFSQSYEYFHCLGVTVAVPWPNTSSSPEGMPLSVDCKEDNNLNRISNSNNNPDMALETSSQCSSLSSTLRSIDLNTRPGNKVSATCPEEKLRSSSGKHSRRSSEDLANGDSALQSRLAWGMVIVTASQGGVIRIYQNYGLPVRV